MYFNSQHPQRKIEIIWNAKLGEGAAYNRDLTVSMHVQFYSFYYFHKLWILSSSRCVRCTCVSWKGGGGGGGGGGREVQRYGGLKSALDALPRKLDSCCNFRPFCFRHETSYKQSNDGGITDCSVVQQPYIFHTLQ